MMPALDPDRVRLIQEYGGTIRPLHPIGAEIYGINLKDSKPPPEPVLEAIQAEMAHRGFVVFKEQFDLSVDQ